MNECYLDLGKQCICQESTCYMREDQTHCNHWYDGEACCACEAPEMPMECKEKLGMLDE